MLYSIKMYYERQPLCRIFLSPIAIGSHELAWMMFMHLELSEHDFWPSRDVVYEHFQAHLHQTFPSKHWMRQKFRIQRPTHCNAQRVALSTYKNTHTLRTMIGITPSVFPAIPSKVHIRLIFSKIIHRPGTSISNYSYISSL